jgi:hypothetical protein
MAPEHRPSEAEIRRQAYYLWEQDGRPQGHDMEYWQRATVAVTEREQLSTLTDEPPKRPAAKRKAAELGAAGRAANAKTAKGKPKKK